MHKQPFIQLQNVSKSFQSKSHHIVQAISDISLDIYKGETLGVVGESGSGKSTLGRLILGLISPTEGQVFIEGKDLKAITKDTERKALRKEYQIIFQDASYAMDPRRNVKDILMESLKLHHIVEKAHYDQEIKQLLDCVGLPITALHKLPYEFSGGERQRLTIAKAISTKPSCIVCDEPLSALDVSVQAKIINLLQDIKKELKLTYIFISHNMSHVEYMSDRIAVIYKGNLVELGDSKTIYAEPSHAHTKALVAAKFYMF